MCHDIRGFGDLQGMDIWVCCWCHSSACSHALIVCQTPLRTLFTQCKVLYTSTYPIASLYGDDVYPLDVTECVRSVRRVQ